MKLSRRWRRVVGLLAAPAALILSSCERTTEPQLPGSASLQARARTAVPGRMPGNRAAPLMRSPAAADPEAGLNPVYTATGRLVLSLDACGSIGRTCTVQVDKPAGARVVKAFAAAATTPYFGRFLAPGEIQLNGMPLSAWTETQANSTSFGTFHNHWADVTSIIKPFVDAAPAGLLDVLVGESQTFDTDGVILAVVFEDPGLTRDHSVVLLFGGQKLAGDQFFVTLSNPVDKSDPDLLLDMSLGISYSFQPAGQYSIVDVNGQRLTTSAGGQDDGEPADGALITVGGIGDSNDNPPPYATDEGGPRTDDELYDLRPFVNHGDKLIRVSTRNPSQDDNIFFSAFYTTVPARVDVPEPVTVDVRPGDDSNTIILGPQGQTLISVVLLTTDEFDARTVDPGSATLGNESGFDTPIAEQRSRGGASTPAARLADVDGDGDLDLMMWFDKQQLIANGDLTPSTTQLIFLANIEPTGKARGVVDVTVR